MAKKRQRRADVVIDFKGADPVSGSRRYDRIPEGTYTCKIKRAIAGQTTTDKPSLTLVFSPTTGEFKGKEFGDILTLPRPGTDDPIFLVQRLHGYMQAAGIKPQKGKVGLNDISKALTGKTLVLEVADDEYNNRMSSRPVAWYAVGSKAAKAAMKAAEARTSDDDDEEEEEEEEEEDEEEEEEEDEEDEDEDEEDEEDEDEDEEDDDDEEEEEPPKKKSKRSKKAKKSKVDEDEEDEDEELYDDDDEDEDED